MANLVPSSTSSLTPLYGASSFPIGTDSTIGSLQVSCSGESIILRPTDSQGNSLNITGLRNIDDVQLLSLVGATTATSMTLRLGDLVTAPIPLDVKPPVTAFEARVNLPNPGTYNLSFSYNFYGPPPTGRACTRTVIRIFDGSTLVDSLTLDQSRYPDSSTDLLVENVGVFKALGSFAITTGSLTVWLSGDAGNGPILSGRIRVEPRGNTDPNLVGYIDPTPAVSNVVNGNLGGRITYQTYGTWSTQWANDGGAWHGFYYGLPTGNDATAFPSAEAVRAALQDLASVPPGAVTVTVASNQSLLIHFTGLLGGQYIPTLSVADPAFRVTHDDSAGTSVGGQYPTATINGARYPLRAASYAQGQPIAAFHLVQDTPAVQRIRCGEAYFNAFSFPPILYDLGYSGRVAASSGAGQVATCPFEGLTGPADYEVFLTWPGGDPAGDHLECIIQDAQGNILAQLANIDQSQPPIGVHDDGVNWVKVASFHLPAQINKIVVGFRGAGTPGKHCLIDAVRLVRTSPDQGTRILPGDVVLFDAPNGFVTTSSGPLPAVQSLRVLPAPAQRLPPLTSKLRTMKLGINGCGPSYYGTDSCYSNYAVMLNGPLGQEHGADGYPTKLSRDSYQDLGRSVTILSLAVTDAHGAGLGVPNCSGGTWVVQWRSAPTVECMLLPLDPTTAVNEDSTRRVTGALNRRYYQVTHRYSTAPSLAFQVLSTLKNPDGTFACDLKDLAIYPPDVDPEQPGDWRPSFLEKLQGLQCFRFMDFFGTNNLNLVSFEDFPDATRFPAGYYTRTLAIPIASIGPPQPDPFSDTVGGTVVRVTTTVPHGLRSGFIVGLRTTDGSSLGIVQGNIIDSNTGATTNTPREVLDPTDSIYSYRQNLCHVIDEKTFQIGIDVYSGPTARMTNTLTPANGIVYADVAPGATMSPSDAAQLCAETGLEPWVNIPWLADDDCVARMAQAFVDRTPVGVPVHVEYANEPWNYVFKGFFYSAAMARLSGVPNATPTSFYIQRMGQVHQIFRDVWRRAGRDETEVRRVCGAQQAYPGGTTVPMIQLAVAAGIEFEELTVASYFSNEPIQGNYDDLLTREQLLDLLALNIELRVTANQMVSHAEAIVEQAAAFPEQSWIARLQIVNYEGGPEAMTTTGMTANLARHGHGVHRDPDFLGIMLYWLATLEDAGVRLFNVYQMYGVRDYYQWGVYEGYNMQPGTGIVALDQANRDDFENLLAVKSETAGALRQWSALRVPSAPTGRKSTYGQLAFGQGAWAHRQRIAM